MAGKYRLEEGIARGGMGKVYRATQIPLGRDVAVKVLRPTQDIDLAFSERFLLEASTLAKLQHPHIVTIHDFGRTKRGDLFMVMEFLAGRSLSRTLSTEKRLTVQRSVRVILQVARALRAAHRVGVIHRDLKPSNIMLVQHDDDGQDFVKVVDFGLAKLFQESVQQNDSELTGAGVRLGSPRYMSPEQIRSQPVDPRTDIYSLGIVAFAMIAGRPPYFSKDPNDLMAQHLRDPVPDLAQAAEDVAIPQELNAIVRRCMAKNPDDRFRNIDAVISALKELKDVLHYVETSTASLGISSVTDYLGANAVSRSQASRVDPDSMGSVSGSGSFGSHPALYASLPPQPSRPSRLWIGVFLATMALSVALLAYVVVLTQRGAEPRTVVVDAPKPNQDLVVSSKPLNLLVLDDEGAAIGRTPIRLPRPTADAPLRIRFKQGSAQSDLYRVLPNPDENVVVVDMSDWIDEVKARKLKEEEAERKKAMAAARDKNNNNAQKDEPTNARSRARRRRERASSPAASVKKPRSSPTREEPGSRTPAVSNTKDGERSPRISTVGDSKRPNVGLVDEDVPNLGIIED